MLPAAIARWRMSSDLQTKVEKSSLKQPTVASVGLPHLRRGVAPDAPDAAVAEDAEDAEDAEGAEDAPDAAEAPECGRMPSHVPTGLLACMLYRGFPASASKQGLIRDMCHQRQTRAARQRTRQTQPEGVQAGSYTS